MILNFIKSVVVIVWFVIMTRNSDGLHNYTNINNTNYHPSLQLTEHKKYHAIWRWKSRSWLGTNTKTGYLYPNPPLLMIGSMEWEYISILFLYKEKYDQEIHNTESDSYYP
jgi:hypothetical protein